MEDLPWGVTQSDGVCKKTTLAAVWRQGGYLRDDDKSPGGDDKSQNAAGEHGSGRRGRMQPGAGSTVRAEDK